MANALFGKAKEAFLKADIDMENDTIKVILVDTGAYTYSAAHDFLDDVPSGARLVTTAALASKTFTNGVFDAADVTVTDPGGAVTAEALILFQDTGTASTSRLIAYLDTGITGLPWTADGTNDSITWNASGIFSL